MDSPIVLGAAIVLLAAGGILGFIAHALYSYLCRGAHVAPADQTVALMETIRGILKEKEDHPELVGESGAFAAQLAQAQSAAAELHVAQANQESKKEDVAATPVPWTGMKRTMGWEPEELKTPPLGMPTILASIGASSEIEAISAEKQG